jgi:enoyl-CoA hydratase/carnithine racemase
VADTVDRGPAVVTEIVGDHIGIVRLNQPETRNALTPEIIAGLRAAWEWAEAEPDLRCLVVTGTGAGFCAGADFSTLQGDLSTDAGDAGSLIARRQFLRSYYDNFLRLADLPMPTIAAINGAAIGAGFAFALAADIRTAAREAKMGATFTRIGLHPGGGTTYLLPRLIGLSRALELLYTGRVIDGAEAERIGLVNHAVPGVDLLDRTLELAREIADAAPWPVRLVKQAVYEGLGIDPRANLEYESFTQTLLSGSDDAAEGIAALRERRTPKFTGR